MADRVVILGAGLAGLAAATALGRRGFDVLLLESRHRLGGRASSFTDAATGQVLDVCQHVSMGCCTNFAHFARTVGVAHLLQRQPDLFFMTPDRRVSRFRADPLPAPLHLVRSFLIAHYLRPDEKLRVAWGLACLRRTSPDDDRPFLDWLRAHRQTPRTVDALLGSRAHQRPERDVGTHRSPLCSQGLRGWLPGHRRGFEVELPQVPLARLYGEELQALSRQPRRPGAVRQRGPTHPRRGEFRPMRGIAQTARR